MYIGYIRQIATFKRISLCNVFSPQLSLYNVVNTQRWLGDHCIFFEYIILKEYIVISFIRDIHLFIHSYAYLKVSTILQVLPLNKEL